MAIAYSKTNTSLSVIVGFVPKIIPRTHPNFDELCRLVVLPDTTEADIVDLIDIPTAISKQTGGFVSAINGRLYYKGFEVNSQLAKIILSYLNVGDEDSATPLIRFMEKAFANPDPRAAEGLYDWLIASQLPIAPDGDILAWKAVQDDYYSIHSGARGRLRHCIGDIVEEPRHETDSDPNETCSRGIHFAHASYLPHYAHGGSRIVVVKISPTDVVAFPKDYNLAKGRACRMEVVGEVPLDQVANFYPQGTRVYSGWSKPVDLTKPAAATKPAFATGQVWKARDGQEWVITKVETEEDIDLPVNATRRSDGAKEAFTLEGLDWGDHDYDESDDDLVEFVSDKLAFAVGQVWADRAGFEVTIVKIAPYITGDAKGRWGPSTYSSNGAYRTWIDSPEDLVKYLRG